MSEAELGHLPRGVGPGFTPAARTAPGTSQERSASPATNTGDGVLATLERTRGVPSAGRRGDADVQAWHFLGSYASILQGRQWKLMQMNAAWQARDEEKP